MSFHIEITTAAGETRRARIDAAKVWLGSGDDADVRLRVRGLAPRELCFVRTDRGYRLEPRDPGAMVTVNGEALFCKDLINGDCIEVAGLELRWVVVYEPAKVAEPAVDTQEEVAAGPLAPTARPKPAVRKAMRSPAKARRAATLLPAFSLLVAVVLVVVLILRGFAGSTWPQTPQHYVELARAQLGNNQPQRALDTLAFALREASGATREQALQLQAEIQRMQLDRAELPKLITARQELDLLRSFAQRHLAVPARPPARELLQRIEQWQASHGETCRRHAEGEELLRAMAELQARYTAVAELDTPEAAADVLFVLQVLPEVRWRDYPRALARLDRFLRANPTADEVRRARDQALIDGEAWLQGFLRQIDGLLDRGDSYNAERELDGLQRFSALPQWQEMLDARRRRLSGG